MKVEGIGKEKGLEAQSLSEEDFSPARTKKKLPPKEVDIQ